MRKEFNWNNFKNEKIAVCCETEEEAKDFIECAFENGINWWGDDSKKYKERTCYSFEKNSIYYGSISFYEKYHYTILKWCDYMEKEFTINDLKSGYMVELACGRNCMVVEDYYGLILYDVETSFRVIMKKDAKLKDSSQSTSSYSPYAITKVYGYKNQITIEDRELLWEYKKPEPTTLKCETENFSVTKNDENTIIKNKDSEISVSIPNEYIKELLPTIQELFREYKTVDKFVISDAELLRLKTHFTFLKGDTVMVNSKYPCRSYRGERGVVLGYFNEYIRVNLYRTNDIIEFSPNALIKL